MTIKKIIDLFIKDNKASTLYRYSKYIIKLMGKYNIEDIDKPLMNRLLIKLDYMEYETGYAVVKDNLYLEMQTIHKKGISLKKYYNNSSSTLFKIYNRENISISTAVEFCNEHNLKVVDNFKIVSIKKTYSIESKENIKNRINMLFKYAIKLNLISDNPVPKKYTFKIDEYTLIKNISNNAMNHFVNELFETKNINAKVAALIYILVKLDSKVAYDLKIKNIDFDNNVIRYGNKEYTMSEYISGVLYDYFANENTNNAIIGNKNSSYLRTIIYRIRDAANLKVINIESLRYNINNLLYILNSYTNDNEVTILNYKDKGFESKNDYNDFKEFLRLKKMFEVAV